MLSQFREHLLRATAATGWFGYMIRSRPPLPTVQDRPLAGMLSFVAGHIVFICTYFISALDTFSQTS